MPVTFPASIGTGVGQVPSRLTVAQIVAPRSVAVVGASEDTGKFGGRVLHHLLRHGYEGGIVPVNPNRPTLFGLPTVASITAAGPVDVAVIALPAGHLVACVEECAAAGVGAAVIITAQMKEIGGDGATRQHRIQEIARASGMRLVGPNCLGLVNVRAGLALTPSFAMSVARLPAGGIGVVSQSGALMATMFNRGHDLGCGFSTLVSVGNQADVTENDVLEYLIGDPATAAIVLYAEGLSDARRFLALADAAQAAGKPVVAVKAGRSAAGQRAVLSHTASLAGPYRLFAAAAEARGVVLADDPETAVVIADALVRWPAGLPQGCGIAPASASGGAAAVLADRLADAGLQLAIPGTATRARLAAAMPAGQPPLPFDAGALRNSFAASEVAELLQAIIDDPAVGALVYLMTTQPQSEQLADEIVSLGRLAGKPVLLVLSAGSVADPLRERLRHAGFAWHERLDDAMRVLRVLTERGLPPAAQTAAVPVAGAIADLLAALPAGELTAPQARMLAVAAGIVVAEEAVVHNAEAAADAAERFGWPVVLKALVRDLSHKSDRGGVRLDLRDSDVVRATVAEFGGRFGADLEAVLVQPQIAGVAELIVGAVWDDALGPFVLVGAGGIFAELFDDTSVAPAPVAPAEAAALLAKLRLWPVLQGARGRPPADWAAAVNAIEAVGRLAAALGPRLAELDINPLILRNEGAVAVDVRARLGRAPQGEAA